MPGLSLSLGLGFGPGSPRGGISPPTPGGSPTTLPTTPAVAFHPNSQTGAVTRDSTDPTRIVAAPDLMALAGMSQADPTKAPVEMTDALGRKFWRFSGTAWAQIANTLNGIDTRAMSFWLVGRVHKARDTQLVGVAYQSDGVNGAGVVGSMRTAVTSSGAPTIFGALSTDANFAKMIPGSQLQLVGYVSRTTANGGQRFYLNGDASANATQASSGYTSAQGAMLGATRSQSGGAVSANTVTGFDLYEVALCKGNLTNAQADAIAAAFVSNWAITAIDSQLVLAGDSITDGVSAVTSGVSLGMDLTSPGASLVPSNYRVLNAGQSGWTTVNLTTQRDATNTLFNQLLSVRNVVAVQIGRNNWAALSQDGATAYAALRDVIYTASTGYLQRGWTVAAMTNIATGSNTARDAQVALMLSSLIGDCQAGSGQTYDGKLKLVRLDQIKVGGSTIFEDSADANNTTYYQGDQTHPTVLGTAYMANGGDTPSNGYRAALAG